MKKILVPTDFSENADNALHYAFQVFGDFPDVEFIILNTFEIPYSSNTMLVSILDILKKDSETGLKKVYDKLQATGNKAKIRTVSKNGTLSKVIEDLNADENFDLIVMGTLGAGGLKKVLLGSNTSDVVKKVRIPILIVPNESRYTGLNRILFTTDYKPTDRELQITQLKQFAGKPGAEVFVLNVHEEEKEIDLEKSIRSSGLDELLKGIPHTFHEMTGKDVIASIDTFVAKHNIDVVAMISRKLGFIEGLFHKSLTREMAMHTRLPVLVLHD